jgi:hypothetical protein
MFCRRWIPQTRRAHGDVLYFPWLGTQRQPPRDFWGSLAINAPPWTLPKRRSLGEPVQFLLFSELYTDPIIPLSPITSHLSSDTSPYSSNLDEIVIHIPTKWVRPTTPTPLSRSNRIPSRSWWYPRRPLPPTPPPHIHKHPTLTAPNTRPRQPIRTDASWEGCERTPESWGVEIVVVY